MSKAEDRPTRKRKNIPAGTRVELLTECGYRCAVPTCRTILALDMHHMAEVSEGGSDDLANLIALCPTCHNLYHRGTIKRESIYCYKAMLVALRQAFDLDTLDKLLFLDKLPANMLVVSGDGVLSFSRLIAADLASFAMKANNSWQLVTYSVTLTPRGKILVEAWKKGNRAALAQALFPVPLTDEDLRTVVIDA